MSRLIWDAVGSRLYETGIDQVVLYPQKATPEPGADTDYETGVAWNGVSSISENPSGAEETKIWADNIKYLSMLSKEDFGATLEAYMYPDEWALCDGSVSPIPGVNIYQQPRTGFGLCYRSLIGNDTIGESYGYKLHLLYNGKATPSERSYSTTSESPEAATMSYEITTTPVDIAGYKPTSLITIDSTKFTSEAAKAKLKALEDLLYGTTDSNATLPTPAKVFEILGGQG